MRPATTLRWQEAGAQLRKNLLSRPNAVDHSFRFLNGRADGHCYSRCRDEHRDSDWRADADAVGEWHAK